MHAPAAATVIPLPCNNRHRSSILTLSSSSCGHIRLENPLFRIRCRRITRRSASICAELQTSEPMTTTTTTGSSSISTHRVTVHDRQRGVVHEFLVPEDQYILHTAESQNISLPFACRHGCCTSCAVRIKSGRIRQPEALGISAELKEVQGIGIPAKHDINELYSTNKRLELNVVSFIKGYALLCVGFPSSDVEVETQDEDEVYWLQFGRYFARGPIERDDYALELAMGDE